jgi:hypothetical protein
VCLGCGNPLLLLLLFSNCHLDSLHKESTTSVLKTVNYKWSASAKTNAKALALHSQFLTQICQSLSQDDYYVLWIHDDGEKRENTSGWYVPSKREYGVSFLSREED